MKSIRNALLLSFVCIGLIALASQLQAQNTTTPDSIVQVTAEAQGLNLVSPSDLPEMGTFWMVDSNGFLSPNPCLPPNASNLPIYNIADDVFLVDSTDGQVATDGQQSVQDALASLADSVGNLINQVQAALAPRTLARAFGMAETMDSLSDASPLVATFDTNQLWLEITNYDSNFAYLNLHNGTNYVYCVWSSTNLSGGWQIETELFPTGDQTNVLPFTVQELERQNLFLRAMDWTGITSNGNTVPDWWFWKYFGTVDLSDSTPDSSGNQTLLDHYNSQTDPNVITFSIEAANDFVNTTFPNLQLAITAGTPSYYAVLINGDTTTNWLPFVATNLMVSLGSTDGVYNVSIGLRGLPADATQTWNDYAFTLDRVPPALTLTNPVLSGAAATVIKPYLQLQGYASEPLSSLSYDISNALGIVTNQNAFVTDQCFDTNHFDFSTNFFQAYDVPLATNANFITLRVTDRAGNTTTTNFNVVLDYTMATNLPVVALIWPQDGMAVSGDTCTIRGTMSDETGTIMAQVVNGDGTTNLIAGLVERNGMFWIENVPLNGTNQISIQATDAAGHVATNNFTIMPSVITLTIDTTPTGDELYQGYGSVYGTVSDPDATVTVNGMTVTNDFWTDGATWYWEVDNVPIYGQGTATFDAQAISADQGSFSGQAMNTRLQAMNSSSPASPPVNVSADVEMGAFVAMVSYNSTEIQNFSSPNYSSYYRIKKDLSAQPTMTSAGQPVMTDVRNSDTYLSDTYYGYSHELYSWSDFSPVPATEQMDGSWSAPYDGPAYWPDDGIALTVLQAMPHEDQTWGCASCGSYGYEAAWVRHYYADGVSYHWDLGSGSTFDLSVTAKTKVTLFTGGKAQVNRQNLFQISASASEIQRPPLDYSTGYPWWHVSAPTIDPTKLVVAGQHPGSDGNLWLVLPENSVQDLTVQAPGKKHYDANSSAQKYKSHFEVFVDMPWPCQPHLLYIVENGSRDFGHVWWRLSTEAPGEAVNKFMPTNRSRFLNEQVGYGCYNRSVNFDYQFPDFLNSVWVDVTGPGVLYDPDGDPVTTSFPRNYDIGFNELINALGYTDELKNHPGMYSAEMNNCVIQTKVVGGIVGVSLPDSIFPEEFGLKLGGNTCP